MLSKKLPGPILVAATLIGLLGVVHGVYADRWGPSGQLQQATAALERVPPAFGDWAGEDLTYEPEDMARAGIKRCVFRRYRNPRTREEVSFLLVCGRGGPISVHTPDVCYAGAGYRQIADAELKEILDGQGGQHAFRVARFAKPGTVAKSQLEVSWSWSRDGRVWQAPENVRLTLARSPALYKLYIVREFVPDTRAASTDTAGDFLRVALPETSMSIAPQL